MNVELPREVEDIAPPPRKVTCPVLDFHVHAFDVPETRHLLRSMGLYGIESAVVITNLEDLPPLREHHSERFFFCLPLDFSHPSGSRAFCDTNLERISRASSLGVVAIKLWFQPRFMAKHKLSLNSPHLQPLFDAMSENKLLAIVHIADPDIWYATHYADRGVYGSKKQHLEQLEDFLSKNPELNVVCAHFAGYPENLEYLSRLLDTYPNVHLDTSATKWITRELGKKPEQSRRFLLQYAPRIVFGSDNYVFPETDLRHFSLRYYVHRMFWETAAEFTSPIPDPDAGQPVRLRGLNLPEAVLQRLYFLNGRALLKAAGVTWEGTDTGGPE
jgi:rhodanese-related sulfurtransferase